VKDQILDLNILNVEAFKNFDEQNLLCDLDNINWDIDPNSDINSQYENF
jgi:hypothetical protein